MFPRKLMIHWKTGNLQISLNYYYPASKYFTCIKPAFFILQQTTTLEWNIKSSYQQSSCQVSREMSHSLHTNTMNICFHLVSYHLIVYKKNIALHLQDGVSEAGVWAWKSWAFLWSLLCWWRLLYAFELMGNSSIILLDVNHATL